jgi:pyruvate,water dikinase
MRLAHLEFPVPGPGLWATDGLHGYRPATPIGSANKYSMAQGFAISAWRYGALTESVKQASIHRFGYMQMRQLISRPAGPDETARARFDAEVKANPAILERFARADETFASKRWRADIDFWDNTSRPWLLGRTLELTDLDPTEMDDQGLLMHLREAIYQMGQASQHHHILNMANFTPRGLFVLNASDWTGLSSADLEPAFVGSSPISAGDEPELRALVAAIQDDEQVTDLVTSDDNAAQNLAALQAHPGDVGKCTRAFVRMVGMRTVVGWEVMNPYVLEKPELLIGKIRHGLTDQYATLDEAVLATIRDKVPDVKRNEFDELLKEARKYSRIRDERDIYCNMPVGGIIRRAVLEIGRRLKAKALIDDIEFATEASADELESLLINGEGPSGTELRERYEFRHTYSIEDVPETLGTPNQEPVDPDWLPSGARIYARMAAMQAEGMNTNVEPEGALLQGRAASPGTYTGRARVIANASQLDLIEEGDVLITTATNPAFNIVLPKVGAIVTQYGGLLSHAAIVAREFGLPAVVGCRELLNRVEDGAQVVVDGEVGTVSIL